MSRINVSKLDTAARKELASRVKALRRGMEMTQGDLAKYASVSRQTLSDIENGNTIPQQGVLFRILHVLGIDEESPQFESQTELWLSLIGTLIETIPEPKRGPAVDRVVRSLADDIKAGAAAGVSANYEDEDFEVSLDDVTKKDVALAAKKGKKKVNEDAAE